MMQLSINAIKRVAACALFMPATWIFSENVHAQTVTETLTSQIETSLARVAPVRMKLKEPQQRYALEKAQCWLDFSKHEALRNNPTGAPELAHAKAAQLLSDLENGKASTVTALDSALKNNDTRMRNDLWGQLDAIKSSKQISCAVKEVACGEVMLVQAAHAHERIDWRYAQPYFGMAEDWVRSAKKQAAACSASP